MIQKKNISAIRTGKRMVLRNIIGALGVTNLNSISPLNKKLYYISCMTTGVIMNVVCGLPLN